MSEVSEKFQAMVSQGIFPHWWDIAWEMPQAEISEVRQLRKNIVWPLRFELLGERAGLKEDKKNESVVVRLGKRRLCQERHK